MASAPASAPLTDHFVADLQDAVGRDHVLLDPDVSCQYETDWMGRRWGRARAVVRPATTNEALQVIQASRHAGIPIVPQGGNTGLVGGGIPRGGELVVSTTRLVSVGEIDTKSGQLAVGSGTSLARARAAAMEVGLDLGIDLASRDSATVGGMVATNAGGLKAHRYGHMRAHVAGLEAVTPTGNLIRRMGGLRKDNAGYDLTGLMCGSEGTLGLITEVLLQLVPSSRATITALFGVRSLREAMTAADKLRRAGIVLDSLEVMFADGVTKVSELFGVTSPLGESVQCQLLIEVSSATQGADGLLDVLAAAVADCTEIQSSAIATDTAGRAALWAVRERLPEVVGRLGVPKKLDVSVPLSNLVEFEDQIRQMLAQTRMVGILYGHAGDGSLHVNVADLQSSNGTLESAVFEVVARLGGSISAEHGIGRDKRPWLHCTRGPGEIAMMRAIKSALDPDMLFNPGVLIPESDHG